MAKFCNGARNGEPCALRGASTVRGGVFANLLSKGNKAAHSYSTTLVQAPTEREHLSTAVIRASTAT